MKPAIYGRREMLTKIALGSAAFTLPQPSFAHSVVVSSQPAAGSTITGLTCRVRIVFNNRIDASRSRIQMMDTANTATTVAVTGDDTRSSLNATFEAPRPGPWQVEWQVLSADGHIVRGRIPFTIAA